MQLKRTDYIACLVIGMLLTIALISTVKIYIILTHSDVGETGASCHTGLVIKKLITQSIYTKFSFLYYRLLT